MGRNRRGEEAAETVSSTRTETVGQMGLMSSPSPLEECVQNHKENILEACCLLSHRTISAVYLSSN